MTKRTALWITGIVVGLILVALVALILFNTPA